MKRIQKPTHVAIFHISRGGPGTKKCNQWDLPMEANIHRMAGFMLQATSKRLLQQDALLEYYERLLAVPPAPHK